MSSLLYALDGFKARSTIDIDLLGERIAMMVFTEQLR